MDFGLNEEQRAIVATVRDFVRRELVPHEDLVEQRDEVPEELAREIRGKAVAAGLYAANFPAELGGGGLGALAVTLAERELGWTSWALQALVSRPSNILRACQDGQVETYLLPTIRGERHDCLAMTEPGAGSDVRSMTTRARRAGSDWVISGTKHFISHADVADFVVLFAVTGTEQGARGERSAISAFLVDHDTPGLTVSRGAPSVSHRGYHHCELSFADCRVPGSALLGAEGHGFDLLSEWLGASRLTVAATSVGRARRVLELSTGWAATRQQFGQPIGRFQGVGFSLADMATEIEAAELLTLRAAWRLDQGRMSDADAAMAKLYASETLGRVTDQAVQIFGGMGLMSDLPVERFWRAGWDLKAAAAGEAVDADHGPGGFAGLTGLHGRAKPVIAAVNGIAAGGGFELVLAADLVVAAEHAEFSLPETGLGIIPDSGGVLRLPRRLPRAVAVDMLLTGRPMTAAEACDRGLINQVVPVDQLMPAARALAARITRAAPLAVAAMLEVLDATEAGSVTDGFAALRSGRLPRYAAMLASEDAAEGPAAFAGRRPKNWKGR